MHTQTLDPKYFDALGFVPPNQPPAPPVAIGGASEPSDDNNLKQILLRSIAQFRKAYNDDACLLEKAAFDGWSVRQLAEIFGSHPGTVCRKLVRIEQRFRRHVLADVASYLLRRDGGFTVSTSTARPVARSLGCSVSLHGFERVCQGVPSRDSWHDYIARHWNALTVPHPCPETGELRPAYLGGFHCPRTGKTFMDVSVIVHDRDMAMRIGTAGHQQCIFDLGRNTSIQL